MSEPRFTSFPRTQPPPAYLESIINVFKAHTKQIGTVALQKGLTSDGVLSILRDQLLSLKFAVEMGKSKDKKIKRPVYFGENGIPTLQYEIDAYHTEWQCGLEIEAGRAWMGNAIYRDLVQALIMVNLHHLILAVPNTYKYFANGRLSVSRDYDNTIAVADAVYGHSRIRMPFGLTVVGY